MNRNNSIFKKSFFINAIFIASILFSSFFLFLQVSSLYYEHDESMFLLGGIFFAKGELYTNYMDNKPPLIFFLLSFVSEFGFLAHRILCVLLLILSLVFYYITTSKVFGQDEAKLAVSLFLLLCSHFEASLLSLRIELFAVFFLSLSLYLIFVRKNRAAAGFFLSLLFFLKPTYMLLWVPFVLYDLNLLKHLVFWACAVFLAFSAFIQPDLIFNTMFLFPLNFAPSLGLNLILPAIVYSPFLFICLAGFSASTKEQFFLLLLSSIALVATLFSLFSFGFYSAASVPGFFLGALGMSSYLTKINFSGKFFFPLIALILLGTFILQGQYLLSLELLPMGIQKAPVCVDCISKNDVPFLENFSKSNNSALIVSPIASIYYPFFVSKISNSDFQHGAEIKGQHIFPCPKACIYLFDEEREYWISKALSSKHELRPDYIIISQFLKIPNISGMPLDEKTFSLLMENYSVYYNGTSVLVLKYGVE